VITTLPRSLGSAREQVEPGLRAAVERLGPRVRRVAGYHLGWWEADGTPSHHPGGKALRPALAFLSARAAGAPEGRGVAAAVAVELVHNFSLLHDDVMDGDTQRRHRPTAGLVFGSSAAILAGDAMLALAADVLADEAPRTAQSAQRCLAEATQRLIAGQAADLDFERRDDVTLAEALAMAEDKTAALMSCACALGALLADAPPALRSGLAGFGRHLGLAFQLVDDLLGIWGSPDVTGKPVCSDLRARKNTLPVVAALGAGNHAAERLRALYSAAGTIDQAAASRAARLVEAAGGRAWAEAECARQLARADRCLLDAAVPPDVRAEMQALARFVVEREH